MDITSLYSNIENGIAISCVEEFLMENPEIPIIQREFFLNALHLILCNNYFSYNGEIYHQKKGTGIRMVLSYANQFMGKFEQCFITSGNPYTSKIKMYRRYIDDLIFLRQGTQEDASMFTDYINKNPWGIIFTANYQEIDIEFGHLKISAISISGKGTFLMANFGG